MSRLKHRIIHGSQWRYVAYIFSPVLSASNLSPGVCNPHPFQFPSSPLLVGTEESTVDLGKNPWRVRRSLTVCHEKNPGSDFETPWESNGESHLTFREHVLP
jgi:hypothetical protein